MDVPFIASAGSIILHSKDSSYPLTHLHGLFSASSLPGPQGFRDEEAPQVTLRGNTLNQPFLHPLPAELLQDLQGIQLHGVSAISPSPDNLWAPQSVPNKFDDETETTERLVL